MGTELLIFQEAMTMNNGDGLSNWYQNAEFSGLYHHALLYNKKKRSINVRVYANRHFL